MQRNEERYYLNYAHSLMLKELIRLNFCQDLQMKIFRILRIVYRWNVQSHTEQITL